MINIDKYDGFVSKKIENDNSDSMIFTDYYDSLGKNPPTSDNYCQRLMSKMLKYDNMLLKCTESEERKKIIENILEDLKFRGSSIKIFSTNSGWRRRMFALGALITDNRYEVKEDNGEKLLIFLGSTSSGCFNFSPDGGVFGQDAGFFLFRTATGLAMFTEDFWDSPEKTIENIESNKERYTISLDYIKNTITDWNATNKRYES
ncbi:MAG: hypothetical protein M0R46_10370 [Candidatus Muirbacterium halophilum]|nr:hypothetical protein [Candidatus Muirbacterium halophilum]